MKIIKRGNAHLKLFPWGEYQFCCKNCDTIILMEGTEVLFTQSDETGVYGCPVCFRNIPIISGEGKLFNLKSLYQCPRCNDYGLPSMYGHCCTVCSNKTRIIK